MKKLKGKSILVIGLKMLMMLSTRVLIIGKGKENLRESFSNHSQKKTEEESQMMQNDAECRMFLKYMIVCRITLMMKPLDDVGLATLDVEKMYTNMTDRDRDGG